MQQGCIFLPLLSCNFNDQLSSKFRFVILCICCDHQVRRLVFDNYQRCPGPLNINLVTVYLFVTEHTSISLYTEIDQFVKLILFISSVGYGTHWSSVLVTDWTSNQRSMCSSPKVRWPQASSSIGSGRKYPRNQTVNHKAAQRLAWNGRKFRLRCRIHNTNYKHRRWR